MIKGFPGESAFVRCGLDLAAAMEAATSSGTTGDRSVRGGPERSAGKTMAPAVAFVPAPAEVRRGGFPGDALVC